MVVVGKERNVVKTVGPDSTFLKDGEAELATFDKKWRGQRERSSRCLFLTNQ